MKKSAVVFLAAFLLIVLAGPAWADYEAGLKAYNKGDYVTALKEWRPLAEQGHPSAQVHLGLMHAQGQGVARDYQKAVSWFRKAAEQNDMQAQTLLGHMYRQGQGVSKNLVLAYKWYTLAAKHWNGGEAQVARERLYKSLTVAEREQGQRLAQEWKPKKPR